MFENYVFAMVGFECYVIVVGNYVCCYYFVLIFVSVVFKKI